MTGPKNLSSFIMVRLWPYLLFGAVVIFYWPGYYGHFVPNDSVSYLSIAEKYAAGDFSKAINAYWSPMISWLIAMMIKLRIPPLIAFHLIKTGSGLLVIVFSQKIVGLYKWPTWASFCTMIVISGWAAYFTLHYLSPDALMTAVLTIYLFLVLSGKWLQKPLMTGVLGAILYFTKAFGFFFFAAHILLYSAWKIASCRKQSLFIIKKTGLAFTIFLLLSLSWMMMLYQRYHQFTVSSAGSYNHGLMRYGDGSVQPSLHVGLLPLPDSAAYNSWEEITLVHDYEKWVPWQSKANLLLQLKVIKNNGWYELKKIYGANPLSWPALAIYLVLFLLFLRKCLLKKNTPEAGHLDLHAYVFLLLYCFGYAMAGVDERYLWIADLILLFLVLNFAVQCSKKIKLPAAIWWVVAAGIVLLCGREIRGKLLFFNYELKEQLAEADILRLRVPAGTVVATHETNAINAIDWLGRWHNHGGLEGYRSVDEMKAGLKQYEVEVVLIPDSVQARYQWLIAESDTVVGVRHWKIYKLHKTYNGF
ncbi:MAG: hypothetical protein ABIX01_16015 [Chitinophagaceae bacterium]